MTAGRERGTRDAGLTLLDEVRWWGEPLRGERTHALLAALALAGDRAVGADTLVDQIWGPADAPANPAKGLQVLVSRTRAQTDHDVVVHAARGYRLGLADELVDALRLSRHLAAARAAQAAVDLGAARDEAREVAAVVVRADASAGPLGELRRRAREHVAQGRRILGRTLSGLGTHQEALELLVPELTADPDDEALLAAVLRSETAVHGAPAALERYERQRSRLRDRLGTDPGPELQRLHAELLARDRPVRAGLAYDASELIGRDRDVAALATTLRSSRVASIVGAGGLGKTRLAHVMGRVAEQPVVQFVELAGVRSPDGVAAEVGSALGVRDSVANRPRVGEAARRADLDARIVEQIGATPTLLILDNCEHVVAAVADLVAKLVARTPALHVLTTSRAPLGLAAERVYPLPELSRDDAVRLFCERATATRPGVRLDQERVAAVVDRLDGLPLAVELAAARVRVMAVQEIERRLDDRFGLLRGGSRAAPERHQTLLAVIDWSWDLLDADERTALRRLAAFRDGFSLDGAASVVAVGDALELVTRLVDQSLVVVTESVHGLRYRLLETVREFGRAKLAEAGDEGDTERRLRAWAVGFAGHAEAHLFTSAQVETLGAVRAEEGNLVDVLRRGLDAGDVATVVPVTATLSYLWTVEGNHVQLVTVASGVEDLVAEAEVPPELEGPLRAVLAVITFNSFLFAGCPAERALVRLRRLGPGEGAARTRALTRVLLAIADAGTAGFGSADTLAPLCEDDDPAVALLATAWSTRALENSGLVRDAIATARRGLSLCDDTDGPWTKALLQAQLAGLAVQTGDHAAARGYAEAALPTMEALGAAEDLTQLRALLVAGALHDGRLDEAEELMRLIGADGRSRSVFGGGVVAHCGSAELALARGDVDGGLARYRAAVTALRAHVLRGVDLPVDYAPWVVYPESAVLAAHARHGRLAEVADLRLSLAERLAHLLEGDPGAFLDYPVAGTVLLALALAELTRARSDAEAPQPLGTAETAGPPEAVEVVERAARMMFVADVFGYNRTLPSLAWDVPAGLVEQREPGLLERVRSRYDGVRAAELREEARGLVAELGRPGAHILRE